MPPVNCFIGLPSELLIKCCVCSLTLTVSKGCPTTTSVKPAAVPAKKSTGSHIADADDSDDDGGVIVFVVSSVVDELLMIILCRSSCVCKY